MKVFLGGTCNDSKWRDELIPQLEIDYFNPVVDKWTVECMEEEIYQRQVCDFTLYVITPKMTGVYSIAEAVDCSNKKMPGTTIFCFLNYDDDKYFTESQIKSLDAVGRLVERNGGKYYKSLEEVSEYLNTYNKIFSNNKGSSMSNSEANETCNAIFIPSGLKMNVDINPFVDIKQQTVAGAGLPPDFIINNNLNINDDSSKTFFRKIEKSF